LNQQFRRAPRFSRRGIDLLEKFEAVDRMNGGERRPRLPGLVRLQVTEEVPPNV